MNLERETQRETVFAVVFSSTVKPEPVVQTPSRPALSEEEVERKSKSIIDEFLHINDYKVLRFSQRSKVEVCLGVQCL